jgi:hypothetical protein
MWDALSNERMGQCTIYNIFTFYILLHECIYNIYKASVCRLNTTDHVLSLVASAYEF